MFYRRKILLSLLQLFDGQLDKIRLQKLLFLMSQRQAKPEYEFIPYRFGCYSYSANADLYAMTQKGLLTEDEKNFTKKDPGDYISLLKPEDRLLLTQIKTNYGAMDARDLMKHTYVNFPFYAIKSEVAHHILNAQELQRVENSRPKNTQTILFTIGYEGISLEQYLLRLLKNDVKVLVDVRNNPLSMKYGFSKSLLKKFCNSIGIEYVHFPEVGIQSDKRQALTVQADYDRLFAQYRQDNLPHTKDTQSRILELLIDKKRIALTCFEANICQCHRKHLAEAIEKLPGFHYELKHI
ncbi:MAG: DUF488 domain-containing protein [Bacteroidia bacterium]|nr:DUF488 domain-containing protein [Bacteroidia bacterium]